MIKPLYDKVVIRKEEVATKTSGGILLPGSAADSKHQQGVVVAVGPGTTTENGLYRNLTVKVNDVVLFGQHAGSLINVDGEELVIMKESDIYGIIG